MGRKAKYSKSKEFKTLAVKRYLNGEGLFESLGKELNIGTQTICRWTKKITMVVMHLILST